MMKVSFGLTGYIALIAMMTIGHVVGLMVANNTAVMTDIKQEERGVISGKLSLSCNLGLITGASVMGAVFTQALETHDITTATPEAVAIGKQVTFMVAAAIIVVVISIALASYRRKISTQRLNCFAAGCRKND